MCIRDRKYALHYKTGKPIPLDLVKKINAAATFNKGFETIEYLSSALIDMNLHLEKAPITDPDKFELSLIHISEPTRPY